MKKILLRGGVLLEVSGERKSDILISGGVIEAIGEKIEPPEQTEILDLEGFLVAPGFIDMHVHLRDPGYEYKEDLISGSRAAVAGGYTALAAMANTDPVIDDPSLVTYIKEKAQTCTARIYPIGAVSKGLKGEEMAEMGRMKIAGAVAFSDDGCPIASGMLMRNALQYAKGIDTLIIAHEEEPTLSAGGVMHEGAVSSVLGLRGIPAESEEVMLARDLILLRQLGGRIHIAHLSSASSVEMVRRAKAEGLSVTAEVTPHHLLLTDRIVKNSGYSTNTKVNPPLCSEQDRQALWEGLFDGTIDVIASDHAPHHPDDKDVEFDFAPFGIAGLETTLPLMLDEALSGRRKELNLPLLVEKMSAAPARILGLPGGAVTVGGLADLTVIDPERTITVKPENWYSKSRNTPFAGRRLTGAPVFTLVGGKVVMKEGVVAES